ncbi:MAG: tripartite tricarboxylate transporter TctB family protein [Thiolinea sp.]
METHPDVHKLKKHPGESVFGWLMLGFSLFMFYQAYQIAGFSALSSPGSIPLAASAIMIIAACLIVIQNTTRPAADRGFTAFREQIIPASVAVFCGLILVFAVVLKTVGFILTAFTFLLLSIWFLHKRGFIPSLLLALVSIVLVYIVFRLVFQVVLPEGIVPERDIMAAIGRFFSGGAKP